MPPTTIDYYFSLNSPWSYFGHARLIALAQRFDAAINTYPVDFRVILSKTGGLPLPKRSPQRQAYRLQELARWRDRLGLPLEIHPAFWPADEVAAATMVLAAAKNSASAALALAGAFLRAVWAENRNIADRNARMQIATASGLDGATLEASAEKHDLATARIATASDAIARGVFGAPTYILGQQMFWGQDRLDFLEQALGG